MNEKKAAALAILMSLPVHVIFLVLQGTLIEGYLIGEVEVGWLF